jgi:hypothetical protein
MNPITRRLRAGLPLAAGLLLIMGLVACGGDDTAGPAPEPPPPTIRAVVDEAGDFPDARTDSTAFAQSRFDSTAADPLSCTDFEGEQLRAVDQLTVLSPSPLRHHAAAILQGAGLHEPSPPLVVADRAGAALTLTDASGAEVAGAVSVADADTIDQWRRRALAELGDTAGGAWTLRAGVTYNAAHIALLAGVDQSAMPAEAVAALAPSGARGRVLAVLRRVHHTVDATYPGLSTHAFADGVDGTDLEGQVAPGNPPAWVARVHHGELALLLVQADAGPDTVLASVAMSLAAAAEGRALDADVTPMDALPEATFNTFAVGADAAAMAAACASGHDDLSALLAAAPLAPADLPVVAADLESLRRGDPVRRQLEAPFAFTTCEVFEPVLDDVLWAYSAADARTERVVGDLQTNEAGRFYYDGGTARFDHMQVNSIPDLVGDGGFALSTGTRRPFLLPDAINGRPVVEFFQLPLPGGVLHSQLQFDGSLIAEIDYTIFVVCGLPAGVRFTYTTVSGEQQSSRINGADYFLHGTGEGTRNNMRAGFPERGNMEYNHYPYLLEFPHTPEDGWHVYALRFGVGTGMAVYCDGELLDSDPTDVYPLNSFPGATLCARWLGLRPTDLATFWLAEIAAYRGDASEADIIAETERLQRKYGIIP